MTTATTINRRTKSRPDGSGSIYKTSAGIWKAAISVRSLDGKQKRITRNAKSAKHAQLLLDELRLDYQDLHDNPLTVTVYELFRRYLAGIETQTSTAEGYRSVLELHIRPTLGNVRIESLTALQIQDWLQGLRRDGVGGRTMQLALSVLNRALTWAVKARLCRFNACDGVRRPRHARKLIEPFTQQETAAIIEATRGDRLEALYVLAFSTGARIGELFGLQWDDIDFARQTISIKRQAKDHRGQVVLQLPKTEAGIRTIAIAQQAVEALQRRKERAKAEGNRSPQVFCSPMGMLMRRTTFARRVWKPLLEDLQIRHRGFHHMRHTAVTNLLTAGVGPNVVAGVIGHRTPETVLRLYSHFIPKDSKIAAEAMDRLLTAMSQQPQKAGVGTPATN